jgi:hypothetical protein
MTSKGKGDSAVTEPTHSSISALHKLWAELENEQHELAIAIERAETVAEAAVIRDRHAWLLLEISAVVAEIRVAPATTVEDYAALLDVALEHEVDLAGDMGFYGPRDFPMITRLVRALADTVPGFEFNSLRRSLSSPGQYEQVFGDATSLADAERGMEAIEPIGFGER